MSYKIDLHLHTFYSDGVSSPTEIVKRAKGLEYHTIAITDHDGVDGVGEALIAGDALDVEVIPGIEFSAEGSGGVSLHILGYYIDTKNEKLLSAIRVAKKNRRERNDKLLVILKSMGCELSLDDLKDHGRGDYIGKPNIARAMAEKGYIDTPDEAFGQGKFLESAECLAIKKEKLPVFQIIGVIKQAGGIAVLAHPMKIKGLGEPGSSDFYGRLLVLIKELKGMGLSGMECYHRDHTMEQALALVEIAEKLHLHITEGSDFHG